MSEDGDRRSGNLILVGMMGAGKTTVGRLLARRLKRAYYDSDEEVERRCGVRISVIFDIEGEEGFRARESQVIAELCALEGVVLATGGGAVLTEANRRCMASRGTVIYLHARPAHLWQRVRHDRNRPLLATSDPQRKLEELYAVRDPLYREIADIVIDTGKQSVQTLARDLLARLDAACRLSA
ncbi:MAG: shikimate kinase [Burkholderiales bacterium]